MASRMRRRFISSLENPSILTLMSQGLATGTLGPKLCGKTRESHKDVGSA